MIATDGGRRAVLGEIFAAEAAGAALPGSSSTAIAGDTGHFVTAGVTIYARGITPASGTNVDVSDAPAAIELGGLTASDGDLVLGDGDVVVVAVLSRIVDVLDAAKAIARAEARILAAVQGGEPLHAQLTTSGEPGAGRVAEAAARLHVKTTTDASSMVTD